MVENHQCIEIGMRPSDAQVTQNDVDLLAGVMDAADAWASWFADRRERSGGTAARGPCSEVCLDQAQEPAGIEVADGDQHRVLGNEMTAVV